MSPTKPKKYFYTKLLAYTLIVVGVIIYIVSTLSYVHQKAIIHHIEAISITKAPSSVKPSKQAVDAYSVPATDPKYISIPTIGLNNSEIVQLGLLKNNAIATPDNVYQAGWYEGSSKPGQAGAMFIYGHVSSWTADGIFYNLKQLRPGDKVEITTGNNTVYTYQVISSKVYPYNNINMSQVLAPIQSTSPGLNLMTCTGHVISGTNEFNERLVVFSKLLSS